MLRNEAHHTHNGALRSSTHPTEYIVSGINKFLFLSEHDFVILVGADIPQMTRAELLNASAWLAHEEQARFVFGPNVDGGFWVFGDNCSILQSLWTDVVYSVADTGTQFFKKLNNWEPLGLYPLCAMLMK